MKSWILTQMAIHMQTGQQCFVKYYLPTHRSIAFVETFEKLQRSLNKYILINFLDLWGLGI